MLDAVFVLILDGWVILMEDVNIPIQETWE